MRTAIIIVGGVVLLGLFALVGWRLGGRGTTLFWTVIYPQSASCHRQASFIADLWNGTPDVTASSCPTPAPALCIAIKYRLTLWCGFDLFEGNFRFFFAPPRQR